MSEWAKLSNPIWWVQLQIQGGWRRLLGFVSLYAGGLVGGWILWRRLDDHPNPLSVASRALVALSAIQGLLLVMGGATAIARSIGRDMRTMMIESHRISPMGGARIALGYLFGPTLLVTLSYIAGMVFGATLSAVRGLPVSDWLAGSALLYLAALSMWSLAGCNAMLRSKQTNAGGIIIAMGALFQVWLALLPGAALILGVFSAGAAFVVMNGKAPNWGIAPSASVSLGALAVLMTWIWAWATVRKFRRPDVPAFDTVGGMLLLILFAVTSLFGLEILERLRPNLSFVRDIDLATAMGATMIALGASALIPLRAAIAAQVRRLCGADPVSVGDHIPAAAVWIGGSLFIVVIMAFSGDVPWDRQVWRDVWLPCGAAIFLAIVTMDGLWRRQMLGKNVFGVSLLFVMLVWGLPCGLDAIWASVKMNLSPHEIPFLPSMMFGLSPVGTIILSWSEWTTPVLPGLGVQSVLAVVMQIIGRRAMHRERVRRSSLGATSTQSVVPATESVIG